MLSNALKSTESLTYGSFCRVVEIDDALYHTKSFEIFQSQKSDGIQDYYKMKEYSDPCTVGCETYL